MKPELLRQLVAEASVSPSVHNVQPARWRIAGDGLVLLEDCSRRLSVGDPTGNDAAISLGAAAEGLVLAASKRGLTTRVERCDGHVGTFREVARIAFAAGGTPDPLADWLDRRASWRGPFAAPTPGDPAVASLSGVDRVIVSEPAQIAALAQICDRASYGFIRENGFRAELRSWMRLRRGHPHWARDGLNAEAMRLSAIEAFGAGLVLGPLFRPLAAIGLAPQLLAESKSFSHAAGIALLHRPVSEEPFESGRHFHRLWLEIEAAGFGANVLAALADDKAIAAELADRHGIGSDRRLVSAFRFGRRKGNGFARARLPIAELLID